MLPRGQHMWDFTNSLGIFHFLINQPVVTLYDIVNVAIDEKTQRALIDELRAEDPAVIVLNGNQGLPAWDDVSNQVRHYDVSRFILDRYRPFVRVKGYLLAVRKDSAIRPRDFGALRSANRCSSRIRTPAQVPATGATHPSSSIANRRRGRARLVPSAWVRSSASCRSPVGRPMTTMRSRQADCSSPLARGVVATGVPGVERRDVGALFPGASRAGFSLTFPAPKGGESLHVFAEGLDGSVHELTYGESVDSAALAPLTSMPSQERP